MSTLKADLIRMTLKGSTDAAPRQICDRTVEVLMPMIASAGRQNGQR